MTTAADRFALNLLDTITVDGVRYAVYSDEESTYVVREADWLSPDIAESAEDYTGWCDSVSDVRDEDILRACASACDLPGIGVAGGGWLDV